jgi:excisionase family DNA binding protein
MTELMTLQEVASYLRVTTKTIYRLLEKGGIPAAKVGHQWRFLRPSIDEWLGASTTVVKPSVLVVDDDEIIRLLFQETLVERGYEVVPATTGQEGLEHAKHKDFDLVFVDLKMPSMNGAEFIHEIHKTKPDVAVVVITGYPDSELMTKALAEGPIGVMNKPFGESDIIRAADVFLRVERAGRTGRKRANV